MPARAPLLLPTIAFLAGIVAEQCGATLSLLAVAALALVVAARTAARGVALGCAFGLVAGIALSALRGHPVMIEREGRTARYVGTVVGDVRDEPGGRHAVLLAVDGIGVVRSVLASDAAAGDRLLVRGRLEPFDGPRNPGEPSLFAIERADGIAGRLAAAVVLGRAPPDPLDVRSWAARLRAAASRRIRAAIPEPSATILAGALWGERGALPEPLHDAFQATGTVHVLVTAGLHLGVIAGIVVALLRPFGLHRTASCLLATSAVGAYAWISGAHLPSQRAAVMIAVALGARACGARSLSPNALAAAALAVGALWPAAVQSVSFALSFSCVAAIIAFAEPVAAALHRAPLPGRVREALALTVAAQLGTWPLTAAVFSTLAPYALLANAVVVPLTALALTGGLATLVLPPLAPLETLVLGAIESTVRTIAALPGARATLATPPLWSIAGYDALALGAAAALRAHRLFVAGTLVALGSALVLGTATLRLPHGLEITALDVGQGDATVMRTPSDRIVLIDAGGQLERGGAGESSSAEAAGARIVLAYLRRMGIGRVDLLLLTHPHGDHVGACSPIVEAMPVGVLFDSGQTYGGRAYRDCIASARRHGVPVVIARRGMRWSSGDGVTLDLLAPAMPFLVDTGDDVNENSIVAMLQYRDFRELFMGDAGKASEARLLAAGDDLHAHAVKVGHHGSRYASTAAFVAAVHPQIAVISVGRHNTFGHPAPATIEAWHDVGAAVLRTDQCGAITLVDRSSATMLRCAAPAQRPQPYR